MPSATTSPKLSFDSISSSLPDERDLRRAERGRRSRSVQADKKPSSLGVSRSHSRSKSIQFRLGGSRSTPGSPTRTGSWRLHRRTNTDTQEKEKERDRKAARTPSPPPPSTYERGVSFDTFDNRDAPDYSLTLNFKHKGFQLSRRSRTFLAGVDTHEYSDIALEWLMDELVEDGDEIVCLRVIDKDSQIASHAAIEAGKYHQEARKIFEQVVEKNRPDEKAISLAVELTVGKVQETIQHTIRIYEPAVLIVGSRGRNLNGVHGLFPTSVSKYCLQESPIPVIVVGPSLKREKRKAKRLADPSRRSYNHLMEMSERRGKRFLNLNSSSDSNVSRLPDEEAAVAKALGLPPSYPNSRTSLSTPSEPASVNNDEHEATSSAIWNSLDADLKKAHAEGSEATDSEFVENDISKNDDLSLTRYGDRLLPNQASGSLASSSSSTLRPDAPDDPDEENRSEEHIEEKSPVEEDPRDSKVNIPVIVTEHNSSDQSKAQDE